MIQVFLLRHGETPWNADNNRYCGRTDAPLTAKGMEQAAASREKLKHIAFDGVYASSLQRARITAEIVTGKEVITDQRLIELDFGDWELRTKEEFIAADPVLWNRWMSGEYGIKAGNTGETMEAAANRVSSFFRDLFEEKKKGTFLVAAHNAVNRFFLAQQLGMPLHHYRRLWFDNGAVTEFVIEDNGDFVLRKLNA